MLTSPPSSQRSSTHRLKTYSRLLVILLLFTAGVLLQEFTMPVMEGYDETLHYSYVERLRTDRQLPDRAAERTNSTRQESGQPPLTYWTMAVFLDLLRVPMPSTGALRSLDPVRNMWFSSVNPWRGDDNANVYYHGVDENLFGHPDVVAGDRAARLVSLTYGLVAVMGAYGAAREVFVQERWAFVATALFALTPQMLQNSAVVSNDVGATAFATLVIWQALRLVRSGATRGRLVGIGVLLGLTGLSKVNALLVGAGAAAALIVDWRARHLSLKDLAINALWVGIPFTLLFGPWVLYGWVSYRSPFGLEAHSIFQDPTQSIPAPGQVLAALLPVYMSYLGKFGGGGIWMPPLLYWLLSLIVLASAAGYLLALISRPRLTWGDRIVRQGTVLAVTALAMFAGLLYWLLELFAIALGIQGRLVYPAHAAFTLLTTGGLALLAQRLPRRRQILLSGAAITLPAVTSLILVPAVLHVSFAPPALLTHAQLPALQGSPIDFDHTLRLLGHSQASPIFQPHDFHTITLCWEVLQPTTRPAVFSLKVYDGPQLVADRTSIPGLGHFNSAMWKTGDIFCDAVDLLAYVPLKPAYTYDVLATILDWPATTPDGRTIENPFITQVASPAGDMTAGSTISWQKTGISFGDLASLEGITLDGTPAPGASLKIGFLWNVRGRTTASYVQFIHLVGPRSVSLGDGVPRADHYPTWAWSPGEKIIDPWQVNLPDRLPPGNYALEIGLYRAEDGSRLSAFQDGQPLPSDSAPIITFTVGSP
ncbi:MAG TPA: glycosyltransferase family 39 protein [Aggregatilineales bacterium]|nr:glycosyltransferase family 39 protein [Aggregatilineales bacterium]